jgi:hypothetical protein
MNQPTQRGRPPHESESATSRIVMRVTPHRKVAYVRAANGEPLTEWATRHLDAAAGYKGDKVKQ